jgi:hypothetical protein
MPSPRDIVESSEFTQKRKAIIKDDKLWDEIKSQFDVSLGQFPEGFPVIFGHIRKLVIVENAWTRRCHLFFYETERTIELIDIMEVEND